MLKEVLVTFVALLAVIGVAAAIDFADNHYDEDEDDFDDYGEGHTEYDNLD